VGATRKKKTIGSNEEEKNYLPRLWSHLLVSIKIVLVPNLSFDLYRHKCIKQCAHSGAVLCKMFRITAAVS
jgi:hypothetical protein